jgi:hypothetical protein
VVKKNTSIVDVALVVWSIVSSNPELVEDVDGLQLRVVVLRRLLRRLLVVVRRLPKLLLKLRMKLRLLRLHLLLPGREVVVVGHRVRFLLIVGLVAVAVVVVAEEEECPGKLRRQLPEVVAVVVEDLQDRRRLCVIRLSDLTRENRRQLQLQPRRERKRLRKKEREKERTKALLNQEAKRQLDHSERPRNAERLLVSAGEREKN